MARHDTDAPHAIGRGSRRCRAGIADAGGRNLGAGGDTPPDAWSGKACPGKDKRAPTLTAGMLIASTKLSRSKSFDGLHARGGRAWRGTGVQALSGRITDWGAMRCLPDTLERCRGQGTVTG